MVDTITSLAATIRGDVQLGTDADASIWDRRSIYMHEKGGGSGWAPYVVAGVMIMRNLKNLRAMGIPIVTTVHEAEQADPVSGMKKEAPAVNPELYTSLMGASSDIVRMQMLMENVLTKTGEVKHRQGTRTIQLVATDEAIAKTHVDADADPPIKLPKFVYNPSMGELHRLLGKTPSWLVIYGPPGVGKTVLSTQPTEQKVTNE